MDSRKQAALQAISGRQDDWAVRLRRELEGGSAEEAYVKLEGMPMKPTGMTSAEEAHRMGYDECPRCHGYGSSLQEEADRCTVCGGSGWAKRRPAMDNLPCRHCSSAGRY